MKLNKRKCNNKNNNNDDDDDGNNNKNMAHKMKDYAKSGSQKNHMNQRSDRSRHKQNEKKIY